MLAAHEPHEKAHPARELVVEAAQDRRGRLGGVEASALEEHALQRLEPAGAPHVATVEVGPDQPVLQVLGRRDERGQLRRRLGLCHLVGNRSWHDGREGLPDFREHALEGDAYAGAVLGALGSVVNRLGHASARGGTQVDHLVVGMLAERAGLDAVGPERLGRLAVRLAQCAAERMNKLLDKLGVNGARKRAREVEPGGFLEGRLGPTLEDVRPEIAQESFEAASDVVPNLDHRRVDPCRVPGILA